MNTPIIITTCASSREKRLSKFNFKKIIIDEAA